MRWLGKKLVDLVLFLKHIFRVRTWVIEYWVVGIMLGIVALLSHKGKIEWIGVGAVFFTFGHTKIADRLAEREAKRSREMEQVTVECYWKMQWYFYAKELCWFAYFCLLGAWSALAGVVIFLLYPQWRKLYRRYHPLA